MSELETLWMKFWFSPGSAVDLGIARFLIIGYFLFFKLTERPFDLVAWARVYGTLKSAFPWQVPWLHALLGIGVEPGRWHATWVRIYKAALLAAAVGLGTGPACAVALLLGLYLDGIRHGIRTHHTAMVAHFCLLGFALSSSGSSFSLDSVLFPNTAMDVLPLAQTHGWGLTYIRVVMAIVIFSTGWAKAKQIPRGHVFWAKGNLADLMRVHDFPYFFVAPYKSVSALLRRWRPVEFVLALGTVVLELAFPLVLFVPVAALVFVPNMVLMLTGFRLFVGARFDLFSVVLIASYVPWEQLIRYIGALVA